MIPRICPMTGILAWTRGGSRGSCLEELLKRKRAKTTGITSKRVWYVIVNILATYIWSQPMGWLAKHEARLDPFSWLKRESRLAWTSGYLCCDWLDWAVSCGYSAGNITILGGHRLGILSLHRTIYFPRSIVYSHRRRVIHARNQSNFELNSRRQVDLIFDTGIVQFLKSLEKGIPRGAAFRSFWNASTRREFLPTLESNFFFTKRKKN